MSFSEVSITPDMTSDATFRAFWSAIDTAILALGLVDAGDSGQFNLSTGTKPTVANTSGGFRMYKYNDALASGSQFYLKIELGSGSSATTTWQIWLTVGTTTNGAGVLSGNTFARTASGSLTHSTSAQRCFFSGNAGRLRMSLCPLISNGEAIIVVGRLKDANKNDISDGVWVCFVRHQAFTHQVVGKAGGDIGSATAYGAAHSDMPNSGSFSGPRGLGFHAFKPCAPPALYPTMDLFAYYAATGAPEIPDFSTITPTIAGSIESLMAQGTVLRPGQGGSGAVPNANAGILMNVG